MVGQSRPRTASTAVVCTLARQSRHDVHRFLRRPKSSGSLGRPSVTQAYKDVAEPDAVQVYVEVAKRCQEKPEILEKVKESPRFCEAMKRQGIEWQEIVEESDEVYRTKLLTDTFLERRRVTEEAEEAEKQRRRFNQYIDKLNHEEHKFLQNETRRQTAAERAREAKRATMSLGRDRAEESIRKSERRQDRSTGHAELLKKKAEEKKVKVERCFAQAEERERLKVDKILIRRHASESRLDDRRKHEAKETEEKRKLQEQIEAERHNRYVGIREWESERMSEMQRKLEEKMQRSSTHRQSMERLLNQIKNRQNLALKHRQHNCLRQERKHQYYMAKKAEDIESANVQRILEEELKNAVRVQRKGWEAKKKGFELKQAEQDASLLQLNKVPGPGEYESYGTWNDGPAHAMPMGNMPDYKKNYPGPGTYKFNRELKTGVVKWSKPRVIIKPQNKIPAIGGSWSKDLSQSTRPMRVKHFSVSPRPPHPLPGPGAYAHPPARKRRSVEQVLDDFDSLCNKYAERVQGSPKMRARSASLLRIPGENTKFEGFPSPGSPADAMLEELVPGSSPRGTEKRQELALNGVAGYKKTPTSLQKAVGTSSPDKATARPHTAPKGLTSPTKVTNAAANVKEKGNDTYVSPNKTRGTGDERKNSPSVGDERQNNPSPKKNKNNPSESSGASAATRGTIAPTLEDAEHLLKDIDENEKLSIFADETKHAVHQEVPPPNKMDAELGRGNRVSGTSTEQESRSNSKVGPSSSKDKKVTVAEKDEYALDDFETENVAAKEIKIPSEEERDGEIDKMIGDVFEEQRAKKEQS